MSINENNSTGTILPMQVGDILQIDIADDKRITTHIEMVDGNTIWAADFFTDIWNYRWRRQAFDTVYLKGERCFLFLAEIEGRDTIDKLPVTRLSRISNIQEIQRRSSFRLPFAFDVYMRKMWDKNGEPAQSTEYIKCRGMDISEMGIGFTTDDRNWKSGDVVQCKFVMEDEEYVFDAKVMRCIDWKKDDVYIYRIGIRFNTEDERQLKKIRRFIFKQQVARKL